MLKAGKTHDFIDRTFSGQTVITKYESVQHEIRGIDFTKSSNSDNHGINLDEKDQPMASTREG